MPRTKVMERFLSKVAVPPAMADRIQRAITAGGYESKAFWLREAIREQVADDAALRSKGKAVRPFSWPRWLDANGSSVYLPKFWATPDLIEMLSDACARREVTYSEFVRGAVLAKLQRCSVNAALARAKSEGDFAG